MRKSPKVTEVLPILYLRGLRPGTSPGTRRVLRLQRRVSATTVNRLDEAWQAEHAEWNDAGPLGRRLRVQVGGRDPLQHPIRRGPAVHPGDRRGPPRRDQRAGRPGRRLPQVDRELGRGPALGTERGLAAPVLAVGDGALGFWGALRDVFPSTCEQRCWVQRTENVLDALPKRLHDDAKEAQAKIYSAESRTGALEAVKGFADEFAAFEKANEKITGELDVLLAFFDFPSNIGSTFAPPIRLSRPFDGQAPDQGDPRCGITQGRTGHGLQAARRRPGPLAPDQRP